MMSINMPLFLAKSDMPSPIRREVISRCGGKCEDCGETCQITLHHLHYNTVGRESECDLAALCWDCHKVRHRDRNGDYWRDPEEMQQYWSSFYDALDESPRCSTR